MNDIDFVYVIGVILTGISAVVVGFAGIMLLKNDNTCRNHRIISNAIHRYVMDCLAMDRHILVGYQDMESYDDTMKRIWDFSYKRILPPDKFEIIKPYIVK